jgi:hypothetical protein
MVSMIRLPHIRTPPFSISTEMVCSAPSVMMWINTSKVRHIIPLTILTPHHLHNIVGRNKVVIEEMTLLVVAVPMLVELFAHIRMETAAANTLDILSHRHPPSAVRP